MTRFNNPKQNIISPFFRSSDSTKYGTNKSSGASVTSNGHTNSRSGHLSSSATQLHSVSNRKPPLHPNRQQQFNIKNSTPVPVHNSTSTTISNNNRLLNNTIFQNNQYTFSLSRISGYNYNNSGVGLSPNGYLETRPLSSASIHGGDGSVRYINRGTKSDIGVSVRRNSSKSSSINGNHYSDSCNMIKKTPSVNSDLISYISSASGHNYAYFGVSGCNPTDYLENYRTTKNQLLRHKNYSHNHTHTHSSPTSKNNTASNNHNNLGPLLYLEPGSDNMNNHQNTNVKFNQSVKNVSSSLKTSGMYNMMIPIYF